MGYREAFALAKEEVLHAVPPGTSKLMGMALSAS